jgi:hypothetical protein
MRIECIGQRKLGILLVKRFPRQYAIEYCTGPGPSPGMKTLITALAVFRERLLTV